MRFAFLILTLACVATADPQAGPASLESQVQSKVSTFSGKVSFYAKNLQSGVSFGLRENDPVRTASTIKLAIMIECFFEVDAGSLKWEEPVKVTEEEKVAGSGLLQDLTAGDQLPLRDVMDLMIVVSDNTATNLILNRIGGNAVNARMAQLGLTQTRVMRKILTDHNDTKPHTNGVTQEGAKPENAVWGIGRSTPKEMVMLLEKMFRGELVSKQASDEMLQVLKRQRDHNGMGRDMKDTTIASKSGALDHLRSDVGIIYSKDGPVAMAFTVDEIPEVNWSPENPGDLLISQLSEILVGNLAPVGKSANR